MAEEDSQTTSSDSQSAPRFRYNAGLANEIELKWQGRWAQSKAFESPNPVGDLSEGFDKLDGAEKLYVLDMFPYPSGTGLHVGHPLGFIGTDVLARYWRMAGRNVLHTMGYDAFGLPAEQFAVQTGTHPRTTTESNIANMRRQLGRLGLGHDLRRSVATTDPEYYRWTQWIFLQLFDAWFDPDANKARPISELIAQLDSGARALDSGDNWAQLDERAKRKALLDYRLAFVDDAMVNWCPALGTVLANEEVTNEGRSERGNHPVYRRPMQQWKMRITTFAQRLLEDLDDLDWTESVKMMQRNWIGRSTGASVRFQIQDSAQSIEVFTTRPDTLFGATYMVLAPEHPLVASLTTPEQRAEVDQYVFKATNTSEIERTSEGREKTGVFTGGYAINPVNDKTIPVFVADYVLYGYGTGAIMAVPAHDARDFDFAKAFDLPITGVVAPPQAWFDELGIDSTTPAQQWPQSFEGEGAAVNSHNEEISLDGLGIGAAKERIAAWLQARDFGKPTVTYKLRDWLFSRQRYWGEPFPIVWDGDVPMAVPQEMLPVELPELDDYAPKIVGDDEATLPEPPLGRAEQWRTVTLDLGDGPREYQRELNTMPQWAGSCWYYLRYLDPTNNDAFVDPQNEHYWTHDARNTPGAVDLYVGGVEHAVLHLLYARFWHKVLFDLGHVSTPEPFQRLYNQGMIQADAFTDERGIYVDAQSVIEDNGKWFYEGKPVSRQTGKMGKSLKNSVNPDDIYEQYGADSLRIYEMSMGPLDADRPWTDQGIAGPYRFLQRLWRNIVDEDSGNLRIADRPVDHETKRAVHRTIAGVNEDLVALRFNTAIAKLIELNNHLTKVGALDRPTAEALVLMLAPLAPHISEELWAKLGHNESLVRHPFPKADPALLIDEVVELPVQVQGKVRGRVKVNADANEEDIKAKALAEENVARHVEGREIAKIVVIPNKMVNIVVKG
jgi:leucyl-tRNA synthetase